jgi:predicted transcriptional regulator
MNIDEDTCGWLGLPTPLEMYRQHCRLLENEIQELNRLLRKAHEDVFGISQMLLETQAKNSEYAGYLRERGAEAAAMRKQIDDLTTSNKVSSREAAELRRIVNEMRPRPFTIV